MKKSEKVHIKIGSNYINSSMSVRNLGSILDTTQGIEKYVNPVIINTKYITRIVRHARFGYKKVIQLWLDAHFRSLYNILFHTFKVLMNGPSTLYLTDLIQKYIPVIMFRSKPCSLLTVSVVANNHEVNLDIFIRRYVR